MNSLTALLASLLIATGSSANGSEESSKTGSIVSTTPSSSASGVNGTEKLTQSRLTSTDDRIAEIDRFRNMVDQRRQEELFTPLSGLLPIGNSELHAIESTDDCLCSENAVCIAGECSCVKGFIDISPPDTPGFLCKPVTTDGCPASYATVEGSSRCFKVIEEHGITFDEAVHACEEINATIAYIGTEIETMYLGHAVPLAVLKKESHKKVWIGLRRNQDTQEWKWVSGATTPTTYYGFLPFVALTEEEGDAYTCTLAVGGVYGQGYWIKAPCDDPSSTGYICSLPRTGDFVSEEDMIYRRFQITCCKSGTPVLDEDVMKYVDGWTFKRPGPRFHNQCDTYQGAYRLPSSVFEEKQITVKCECTGENNDRSCRDSRPCMNSGRRAASINFRCACVEPYFGELCEKECKFGRLEKNEEGIDHCECRSNYFGEECDGIYCHNGYEQKGRFNTRCVCYNGFKGLFCEDRDDSHVATDRYRGLEGSAFSQIIATTLPTILFFGILLAAYCACRKVMRSRRRRSANHTGQAYVLPVRTSFNPSFPEEGQHQLQFNVADLKPPPSYQDIFGPQAGASTSGTSNTQPHDTVAPSSTASTASPPSTTRDPAGISEAPPTYEDASEPTQSERPTPQHTPGVTVSPVRQSGVPRMAAADGSTEIGATSGPGNSGDMADDSSHEVIIINGDADNGSSDASFKQKHEDSQT